MADLRCNIVNIHSEGADCYSLRTFVLVLRGPNLPPYLESTPKRPLWGLAPTWGEGAYYVGTPHPPCWSGRYAPPERSLLQGARRKKR
jgi:hypothetical protein